MSVRFPALASALVAMLALPPPALAEDDANDANDEIARPVARVLMSQASRDELFGTKPAAEPPPSRDALFGTDKPAEPKPSYRVSGFIEGLGAYTYSDPSHWSRGVGRFQLSAQGELPNAVKWKVGGRADVDLVYMGSDFYRDAVKSDQRSDFFWRENYLDFAAGDWDFRVGAQQIVWGEVVGLFFADVVSARDMREFLLPSFDVIRIPQWAARAEYFKGDSHVELVWIPVPTFDRIGKPGSEFYPAALPWPVTEDTADLFRDPERPSRTLSNSNYGVRFNTLAAGWDLSAFYYRSYSTSPTFYTERTGIPQRPIVFTPRYDRISQLGGTVSKDFGDVVLRGETVYTRGQGYSLADLSLPDTVVERSTFDAIVGLEWSLPSDSRVNVQVFTRSISGGGGDLAIHGDGPGASLYLSTKVTPTLEPQLLVIHNFRYSDGLVRPRLNWYPAPNWAVGVGTDIFTGSRDGYFGRFNDRDRGYVEVRYTF